MTHILSRRRFLLQAAALSSVAVPACAKPPEVSLRPKAPPADLHRRAYPSADVLIDRANLQGAVGFAVADQSDGTLLENHGAQTLLPPASTAKALTAAYALETLGAHFRFETTVVATGPVQGGTVQGDLILAGGGDPTLDTNALADLVRSLQEAGVTGVTGGFYVYAGALPYLKRIDADQPDQVGYNPALSGLNLNYNRVHFEWRRQSGNYTVVMDARSDKYRPSVRVARMQIKSRNAPVYTYTDAPERDEWTVARGALGKGGARWLPVRKPDLYAGEVFQSFAKGQGIALGAPKRLPSAPKGDVLARHLSAPLPDVLRDMLKYSNNLTAEVVGLTATQARLGRMPDTLRASAREMNRWARDTLGLSQLKLVDHSGLGEDSRVNAQDMMAALAHLRRVLDLKPLLKQFHMRDSKRKIIKNHPITVLAKTGTLNFVSGLAGFVDLPDGRELVFAIFAADLPRRAKLSKAERENPPGASSWNIRAKALQQALIERWSVVHAL